MSDAAATALARLSRHVRAALPEVSADGPLVDAGRRLARVGRTWYYEATGVLVPAIVPIEVGGVRSRFHASNVYEYGHLRTYEDGPDHVVLRDLLARLRPTDVVWDVGANVGVYSCFAAAVATEGSVVAVEPHPQNVDRIVENLSLNERPATVCRRALAREEDVLSLSLNGPDVPGAYGRLSDRGEVAVEAVPGDRLVETHDVPPPTVLAVDVQGSERAVLAGLSETLATDVPRLVYCNVYEKHWDTPAAAGAVSDLLASYGFATERLTTWDGGYFLRGVRR
jgi:FkbM family methyltransferase